MARPADEQRASTRALLAELRQRFEARDAAGVAGSSAAADAPALLPPSDVAELSVEGDVFKPRFGAGATLRANAILARHARAFSTIRGLTSDAGGAMALSFRLAGAEERDGVEADGYVAYPGALPAATLLSRVSSGGIEDYLYFEHAPGAAEVRYDVQLSDEIAGLRLAGGSLEALDASGTPRLRVAPPFLIDADHTRVEASIALEGCAADTSPAAPWGRPVTSPGARRCGVVITWDDGAMRYPALLDPSWSTTGSMAAARAFHTATLLSTGSILVVGGVGSGGAPIKSSELYNPAGSGTWAATDDVPTTGVGRAYHTAVTLNDGTVFVAGGMRDTTNSTNTSAIYTPSTGHWTSKAQMTNARNRHAATVLTTGEVVVTGGLSGSTTVQQVEVFKPTSNTWFQAASSASTQRLSHASVLMQTGDVLIVGGRNGSTTLTSAYSYNLAANAWTARGNLGTARVGHTATTLPDGRILVTGGAPYNSTAVLATCEIFSSATNGWTATADMINARTNHTAALVNGAVVVSGGIGPGTSALAINTAERFKPTFETWTEEPNLNTARAAHTSTVIPSTGVVVDAGGITKTTSPTYLASAERFTPVFVTSTAADYFDGAHAIWSPDTPEVNAPGDPNGSTRTTELKGTMYFPPIGAGQVFPVIVMMHGNHNSCGHLSNPHVDTDNTYAYPDPGGTCPSGFSEVRSDKGFAYLAHELAQSGFIVFSMDANRGIAHRDDGAFPGSNIDTRGRLVLKMLQHMSQWNAGTRATPAGLPNLTGHLDLHDVGLLGHSRGGEGVRAAVSMYANDPTWQAAIPDLFIKGVFEIGSTDIEFNNEIDFDDGNVPWALLMGTCDTNELCFGEGCPALTGIMTFDRYIDNAVGFVGEYFVWGANHNFYNTEWQMSDVELDDTGAATGRVCKPTPIYQAGGIGSGITGSAKQRQTAVYTVRHFMKAYVPATQDLTQVSIFDPAVPAPPAIMVSRAHQMNEGNHIQLEDFSNADNPGQNNAPSLFGDVNTWQGISVEQHADLTQAQVLADHLGNLTFAKVIWTTASSSNQYQVNWAAAGSGFDFSFDTFFELRLDRDPADPLSAATNFSVKLANGNGTFSNSVPIANYTTLTGPAGITDEGDFDRPFPFGAVKIPLSAFGGATLDSIRGVQFVFDQSSTGTIFMANVRMKDD